MGMFNILEIKYGDDHTRTLQFKYGELRLYRYEIGDEILPSEDDYADEDAKVAVDAVDELGSDLEMDWYIIFRGHKIISAERNIGKFNFGESDSDYIVIE